MENKGHVPNHQPDIRLSSQNMDRDSATEDFWSTKCLTLPKRKQQLSKTYKIKKNGKSPKSWFSWGFQVIGCYWTMTIRNTMVSKTLHNHQPTVCSKRPNYSNSVTPCWCGGIDVARHIQIAWEVRTSRVKILENGRLFFRIERWSMAMDSTQPMHLNDDKFISN